MSNELNLNYDEATDSTSPFYIQIIRANVQQILYSVESQTIIYVAMGVRDGGGVGTNYLNMFFDRFDIDPLEYEKTVESPYEEKKVD